MWYLPQSEKKDLEKGKAGNILPIYAAEKRGHYCVRFLKLTHSGVALDSALT